MSPDQLKVAADTAWTLLTGFLVFFMNAGFGLVEAGLCRRKNATMILSKNFVVFAIATLGFYAVGFGPFSPTNLGGNRLERGARIDRDVRINATVCPRPA